MSSQDKGKEEFQSDLQVGRETVTGIDWDGLRPLIDPKTGKPVLQHRTSQKPTNNINEVLNDLEDSSQNVEALNWDEDLHPLVKP